MNFINTKDNTEKVAFSEATLNGLARNKGLYVPETVPTLPPSFFENITQLDDVEIAFQVMYPFVEGSLSESSLRKIVEETLSFPLPVVELDENILVLELFHGPTMAFKDVGARFMARCLSEFTTPGKTVKVIVATSGDTGSAVANGFYKVKGVEVYILFPKGKISAFQEQQMTSLGENIHAIEVDGTFDDCQNLAKQALNDPALKSKMQLSSANSINAARFLPQMLYYFLAWKQMHSTLRDKEWVISVPSGNFGNLTAGLYAKKMGLPVHKFIAANNANDTFYQYYRSGKYRPKPSVQTYSNAMDVGTPSNFERIMHLYDHSHDALKKDVLAASYSDEATLEQIKARYQKSKYVLDPHGAVGLLALKAFLKLGQIGLFLATAHSRKFESVVKLAIPEYPINEQSPAKGFKKQIRNDYPSLVQILHG
jgi:threonine synthase